MTEPGADQRARSVAPAVMDLADQERVDRLYHEMPWDRRGLRLWEWQPLCTRAELWAAIEEYRVAPRPYAAEERERVRALLGMEPES